MHDFARLSMKHRASLTSTLLDLGCLGRTQTFEGNRQPGT
jgi:hypothetical protein